MEHSWHEVIFWAHANAERVSMFEYGRLFVHDDTRVIGFWRGPSALVFARVMMR